MSNYPKFIAFDDGTITVFANIQAHSVAARKVNATPTHAGFAGFAVFPDTPDGEMEFFGKSISLNLDSGGFKSRVVAQWFALSHLKYGSGLNSKPVSDDIHFSNVQLPNSTPTPYVGLIDNCRNKAYIPKMPGIEDRVLARFSRLLDGDVKRIRA